MIKTLLKALQSSDDWDVFDDVVAAFPHRVKAIKLTALTGSSSTALEVTTARGETKSTGELGLHVLEPMQGITAVTDLGAGVVEYRVYYE